MMKKVNIVELEVRPFLRKKLDPFKLIMEAVASLKDEDLFILHVMFKPVPLFGVMKLKGYAHKAEEIDEQYWIVAFARGTHLKAELEALQLRELAKQEEVGELAHEQKGD
ncbi:DUF2249 domain-containing protein [Paenibacillus sp. SI8]|uniref:DUF2249 domain-containing protein n=1 Tax=unclassified Paenibacillus TaxID=185978 RepID=UPI0034664069